MDASVSVSELEEGLKVLESSLALINWRLKPSNKRRLQLDILALSTRLRPVVMIDYGGMMPELQHHLSSLLQLTQKVFNCKLLKYKSLFTNITLVRVELGSDPLSKVSSSSLVDGKNVVGRGDPTKGGQPGSPAEISHRRSRWILRTYVMESPIFEHLRVMVIQDMIYLIHLTELAHHVRSTLNSDSQLLFVDLEREPPKMITQIEKSQLAMQLMSIQKFFLTVFAPEGEGMNDPSPSQEVKCLDNAESTSQCFHSHSIECIDLSNCMDNTEVTVPTLNGWLLGYPVVYLFGKEHIADAIYNLSTKYLHIFQVSVSRNSTLKKGTQAEELLSFSVPYDLSMRGNNEQWAEAFLAHMRAKWERCANAWKSLNMEVSECHPQAIVL